MELCEGIRYHDQTQTLAAPSAVFVDGTVRGLAKARMMAREVVHVVNIPSNPPGWSAGKWGEWYPDILISGDLHSAADGEFHARWATIFFAGGGHLGAHSRLRRDIN
jgi:hypothetical protein